MGGGKLQTKETDAINSETKLKHTEFYSPF